MNSQIFISFYCYFFYLKIAICFITPKEISNVEVQFVKDDVEYSVYDVRVSWNEAQLICESHKQGLLAILDTNKTSTFLAEALAETDFGLESLWIGAQREQNFTWINSEKVLSDSFLAIRGKSFVNPERNCLSFQRKNHDLPNFINLECTLNRPFICQNNYEKIIDGSMTTSEWIPVGKYLYGIFYDEKTWKQSARECRRKHGAHLASFRNIIEVVLLGKFLLIGRPSLENAWIGGYFKKNVWKFLGNGAVISEATNESTLFPPWRRNKLRKHFGCLLLDRHVIHNNTIFLETRCERKRSYICTKEVKSPNVNVFVINNTYYIIFYTRRNWDDALQTCNDMDAQLVRVSPENIHDITYIMGENETEIRHIWISGRLSRNGSHFYWVYDNEIIPPNNVGIGFYPPWYDNEYDQNFACLNMDRENHNIPLFYGVACDTPQAFICKQNDISKIPKLSQHDGIDNL